MNDLSITEQVKVSASVFNVVSFAFLDALNEEGLEAIHDCLENLHGLYKSSNESISNILSELKSNSVCVFRDDFNSMFIGSRNRLVYPWGSYYTDEDKLLFGETTLKWMEFLEQNGIRLNLRGNEPSDHFALILSVLSVIMASDSTNKDKLSLMDCVINQHFHPWGYSLLERIQLKSKTVFYKELASITLSLLNYWQFKIKCKSQLNSI